MKISAINRLFTGCVIFIGWLALGGAMPVFGQSHKPGNVFSASTVLPADVKRVVMLPLAYEEARPDLSDGCEMLAPILQAELVKTKRFEVVCASPEMLRSSFGSWNWTGQEILPSNFFDCLHRIYGCDAVLFCELTELRSSAPLAIGWRLKLVDLHTGEILWAADEIFDAGNPAVAESARRFEEHERTFSQKTQAFFRMLSAWRNLESPTPSNRQWSIFNSPRFFGRFSAAALLETLPKR
jgi:hypothetical protein